MQIKNISQKIIGIGGRVMMPDEVIIIPGEEASTAGVQALANMHLVECTEEAPATKEAKPAGAEAKPAADDAEDKPDDTKAKRGKTKSESK